MAEHVNRLRETVTELERELDGLESLDDETRVVLQEAVSELQAKLASDENVLDYKADTVIERLEQAESDFQASHPTLSGVVMRLVDALGQLGI